MKIKLLVTPRYDTDAFIKDADKDEKLGRINLIPPLGIATLTGFLREHNFNVHQDDLHIKCFWHNLSNRNGKIDLRVFNNEERIKRFVNSGGDKEFEEEGNKILKLTKLNGFDAFGFSLSETYNPSTAGIALTLGKILKEKYDVPILIGGNVHFEVAEMMLRTRFIDYLICGEGEHKLLAFCKNLEKGIPLESTPGIFFINKNKKITSAPASKELEKEKKIPRPCFDGLPLKLYKPKLLFDIDGKKYLNEMLILPYVFVKGCPHKCAFCPDGVSEFRCKPPQEVAEDLKILSRKYKTRYFFFLNTSINPTHEYADLLSSTLIDEDINIKWSDCATFFNMDQKLLKKLREAGATILVFGLESASRRILRFVEKPLPPLKDIEKILKKSFELGIRNELDIICGFPYEREKDVVTTIKFLLKVKKYVLQYHISKFRPSGRMSQQPEKWGIRLLKLKPSTHRPSHSIPYEEIKGLKWKEKARQIDRFFKMINEAVDSPRMLKLPNMSAEEYIFILRLRSQFHQLVKNSSTL